MFDEDFLKLLPEEDLGAILKICDEFYRLSGEGKLKQYDDYLTVYAILSSLVEGSGIEISNVNITGSKDDDKKLINNYFNSATTEATKKLALQEIGEEKTKFKTIRDHIYEYEFSDSDYKKIQVQLNKIRNLISESEVISEDHQNRLLKRLEQFQGELHKRVTNLDRALGFLLDVSIIVKQTGEGAKPIAVVAKEISKIITQVILVSKGLPPGELPLLLK